MPLRLQFEIKCLAGLQHNESYELVPNSLADGLDVNGGHELILEAVPYLHLFAVERSC